MTKPWHPRVIRGGKPPRRPTRPPSGGGWGGAVRVAFAAVLAGFVYMALTGGNRPADVPFPSSSGGDRENPRQVRVVDGDTFDYRGMRVRVADIDTPEREGRCAAEIALAARATDRMRDLIDDGPFTLAPLSGRDEDRYGRSLRIVTRGGRSLGDQLVAEGLARTWSGRREGWC
jgi:endonuclease YncB( thermonuclease family)